MQENLVSWLKIQIQDVLVVNIELAYSVWRLAFRCGETIAGKNNRPVCRSTSQERCEINLPTFS